MNVGIIGAGRLGTALAGFFTRAGHQVMVSGNKGPQALTPLIGELGANASAGTPQEAADFGDIVVLAVQWDQKESAAASIGSWRGRTVLVPLNPLRQGPGSLEVADTGGTPPTELVARLLPGALVVKGFNTYLAQALTEDPAVDGGKVADLADSAGFQAVDTGTLAEGAPLFDTGGPLNGLSQDLLAL